MMPGYLDNAATSHPKPEPVYLAVDEALRAGASPNRGSHRSGLSATRELFRVRERIAAFLGIRDGARLVFTYSATDALNIALKGFLRPGDHVVATGIEHNAVARPLRTLIKKGVKVTTVKPRPDGFVTPASFLDAVQPGTRLAICTHASNVLGAINPVEEIAEKLNRRGIPLLVDAAQTAGYLDIDLEASGIAVWCAPGHKSLLGPAGTGLLYAREDIHFSHWREGGTGAGSQLEMPSDWPEAFEPGTHNLPGLCGLAAAVDYIEEAGLSNIRAHKHELVDELRSRLGSIGGVKIVGAAASASDTPLLSFTLRNYSSELLATKLAEEGYDVRGGFHCAPSAHEVAGTRQYGAVRVSPGVFTRPDEVIAFTEALANITKEEIV